MTNQAPVADAEADRAVHEGSLVTLDGSASIDRDGSIRAYAWSQTTGPAVTVDDADTAFATFAAPMVTEDLSLAFRLAVTDDAGATASDLVEVTITPARFSISGTITAAPGMATDGDVNDWTAARRTNDTPEEAQQIVSPVVLGGYANVAGAGESGPLRRTGDPRDFYRVDLQKRQPVSLLVAEPDRGDLDLYLWDTTGTRVVDASVDVGALETVTAGYEGEYLVEVTAEQGASNYTLVVAQIEIPGIQSGLSLAADFEPGEAIVERRAEPTSGDPGVAGPLSAVGPFMKRGRAVALTASISGSAGRPVLVQVERDTDRVQPLGYDDSSRGVDRSTAIDDPHLRGKYATLRTIKALRRDASVVYAQPNYRVKVQGSPNDPLYPLQWHYPMIDLPAAWDLTTGDASVTVAVLDTGVVAGHPDLAGQLLPGYDFVSGRAGSGDGDGIDSDPTDPGNANGGARSFHGTHVAGTIAAASGNGTGGAGAAPGAKILPVRVLGERGGSSYDILQGVRFAAGLSNDSGTRIAPVDVINLSLGRQGRCWPAEQAAFDAAREAGVVVVAAAGNDGIDAGNSFPASCRNVLAVGAVDRRGERAGYSNFGAHVDVFAPGGRTVDTNGDGYPDGVLSLIAEAGAGSLSFSYAYRHGTSMASAHLAGVVALMKSVNPTLTPEHVDQLLAEGALTGADRVINAYQAVFAALNATDHTPPPSRPLLATPGSLNFGATYHYAEIEMHVAGGGLVSATASGNESWLSVRPLDATGGRAGRFAVIVDRSGLAEGPHTDFVTVRADSDRVEIPVFMQVVGSGSTADAGHLYVVLSDPASGKVVRQARVSASNGSYMYSFAGVDDGRYRLTAGTDADNDGSICDRGESCGGYPALDLSFGAASLTLEKDRTGADFTVGRLISLTDQAQRTGPETARAAAGAVSGAAPLP